MCKEAESMGTGWCGEQVLGPVHDLVKTKMLVEPNGHTLGVCSCSCGSKGSLNEVTDGSDNGAPDRVGLAPQVGHQQADVACHYMGQPTYQSRS